MRRNRPAIDVAREVAEAVGRKLGTPGMLTEEQQVHSDESYRQHLLYVDPEGRFSIVSLVWMPGQQTVIHDHVSWCVVGVHQGNEEETLYRYVDNGVESPYLVQYAHSVNQEGTTSYFVPPGDIHKVCNSSETKVISIHVYGADISVLGSSVRRRYELPVRAA
jgi:predicted metal-dependent enzyme (double-stranded beta helix superfamily)